MTLSIGEVLARRYGLAIPLENPGPRSAVCRPVCRKSDIPIGRAGDHALEQIQNRSNFVLAVQRRDEMHLRGPGIRETGLAHALLRVWIKLSAPFMGYPAN